MSWLYEIEPWKFLVMAIAFVVLIVGVTHFLPELIAISKDKLVDKYYKLKDEGKLDLPTSVTYKINRVCTAAYDYADKKVDCTQPSKLSEFAENFFNQ